MENEKAIQVTGRRGAFSPSVERFIAALTAGADKWREAGEILVQLRQEDENAFERIMAAHAFVTLDMLEVFYHIGTRSLHPLAPLLPKHVFAEVRALGMSYETQETFMNHMVQVVTHVDQGAPVTKMKPIAKLTAKEAKYALCRKGNASVQKQVNKLAEIERKEIAAPSEKYVPTPPAKREPKVIGQWSVRRTIAGYAFEKTAACHSGAQRITLLEGSALIQLVEYKS